MEKLLQDIKKAILEAKESGEFWSETNWVDQTGYLISFEDLSVIVKRIEYLESKVKDV